VPSRLAFALDSTRFGSNSALHLPTVTIGQVFATLAACGLRSTMKRLVVRGLRGAVWDRRRTFGYIATALVVVPSLIGSITLAFCDPGGAGDRPCHRRRNYANPYIEYYADKLPNSAWEPSDRADPCALRCNLSVLARLAGCAPDVGLVSRPEADSPRAWLLSP